MKLVTLHADSGDELDVNVDQITYYRDTQHSDSHPRSNAIVYFADGRGVYVQEALAVIRAILAGTATAAQEAAERADLDERLASIERHLERIDGLNDSRAVTINDLYDKVERLEQQAEDRDRKVGLWWDTMAEALNRKEARIVALEERQSDIMESLHLQRQRIKRLEDELVAIRQNQEWRPAEGKWEPVDEVLTTCPECGGEGTIVAAQTGQTKVLGVCPKCHGTCQVPLEKEGEE